MRSYALNVIFLILTCFSMIKKAAHQLAAETLLSIGPNSRSANTAATAASSGHRPAQRSTSVASNGGHGGPSQDLLHPTDSSRGLKRKGPVDSSAAAAAAAVAATGSSGIDSPRSAHGSPKRRALSPLSHSSINPAFTSTLGGSRLPSHHHAHAAQPPPPPPPPSSYHDRVVSRDVDMDKEARYLDAQRRMHQQDRGHEDGFTRERGDFEKDRIRDMDREQQQQQQQRRVAAAAAVMSSRPGSPALASLSTPPFKYGASLYDHDPPSRPSSLPRPLQQQQQQQPQHPPPHPHDRASPWSNPLLAASYSRPSSPSTAQQNASSGGGNNSAIRKELLEHRESLLDGKRWLEERLDKTERFLFHINERLGALIDGPPSGIHAPVPSAGYHHGWRPSSIPPPPLHPVSASGPGSGMSTPVHNLKDEDATSSSRSIRERDYLSHRRGVHGRISYEWEGSNSSLQQHHHPHPHTSHVGSGLEGGGGGEHEQSSRDRPLARSLTTSEKPGFSSVNRGSESEAAAAAAPAAAAAAPGSTGTPPHQTLTTEPPRKRDEAW